MSAATGTVGLENVQAHHAVLRVEQGEADEIEGNQRLEAAAQIGEQGGELAVGRDGFGHFQQGFIARAGGVRTDGNDEGIGAFGPGFLQP